MNERDEAHEPPTAGWPHTSDAAGSQGPAPGAAGWRPESAGAARATTSVRKPRGALFRVLIALPLAWVLFMAGWVLIESGYRLLTSGGLEHEGEAFVAFGVSLAVVLLCLWAVRRFVLVRGERGITGEVRGMQSRQETTASSTYIVWSFRLERQDASGNRLPPVPVEMRARGFKGFISDGDVVRVNKAWRPGLTLRPRRVRNLTTGAPVKANSLAPLLWALLVAMLVVIAYCAS